MVVPTAGPGGGGAGGVVSEILEVLIDFSPLSPTVLPARPLSRLSMRRKHFRHDTRTSQAHMRQAEDGRQAGDRGKGAALTWRAG